MRCRGVDSGKCWMLLHLVFIVTEGGAASVKTYIVVNILFIPQLNY